MNASRKRRVAAGSGTSVQDINKLLKMHRQMADMMKKMGKRKGGLAGLFGGGAPEMPPEALAEGALPDMADLPDLPPSAMPGGGLPGLPGGGGLPGLPGAPKATKGKRRKKK